MSKTIKVSDEQYAAWEMGEPIKKSEKWQPPGGDYIVDALGMIDWVVHPSRSSLEFGVEYPTRELATRARDFMRPHHRLVAYAMQHWPNYMPPPVGKGATFSPRYAGTVNKWYAGHCVNTRTPWVPYGPEREVKELVQKLNSGEVTL